MLLTQVPVSSSLEGVGGTADGLSPSEPWPGARLVLVEPDGQVRLLSDGLHSASDPSLSFDATRILFAAKETPASRWRIYEMALDGTGRRPVSPEHLDARHPLYVSTLFTLDSPEPWFTTVFVGAEDHGAGLGQAPTPNLYNVKLDGGELRRLTWSPYASRDPFQMWDGRVVYAAERRPAAAPWAEARSGLFAIHIEGADVEFYGGGQGGRFQYMPCATEDGWVVFVESDEATPERGGRLAGVHESRPHLTYRPLTHDADQRFAYPLPWKRSTVLVAARSDNGEASWGIRVFEVPQGGSVPLYDDPDFHDLQARFVVPRARPDGHSTVVNTTATTGTFYGLNCYTAEARLAAHVRPGEVKRVRFIEGVLTPSAPTSRTELPVESVPRRLVGEAPVEADGSFNVEVPANTPLLLQTLDERGMALAACGWIWVQPKETRGCIGCHEDPERIPENEYVLALQRPANRLTLPPEQRRQLSFREDIAPLLRQRCALADCHGGLDTPLHLPLADRPWGEGNLKAAYQTLVGAASGDARSVAWVTPHQARTSRLAWHLFGADTARPWDSAERQPAASPSAPKLMPPTEHGGPLRSEELLTIVQWIDLGAPFDAGEYPVEETPLQQVRAR